MDHVGPFRLASGGQIDRSCSVRFRLDGRLYQGWAGDTLASALLANGVRTVARSFKFHRPRGVFSAGLEEPNALLQINSGAYAIPSARATQVELTDGLEARSQSGWPSREFDLGRALDLVAPLWAAGFYNKTFMWPSWHTYEGVIRRLAGLGRAPAQADPDRYETRSLHCEVLVIGAGVAGLAAAMQASRAGVRVVLADQGDSPGGRCDWDGSSIGHRPARDWVADTAARLGRMRDVTVLTQTTAVGHYDHDVVTLLERVQSPARGAPRERYWIVRPRRIVLATGAMEQPMVFDNNDRPGVMLAGAMREYARRYAVAPGRRVLLATNNDSAYATARDLRELGIDVIGIVDTRTQIPDELAGDMGSLSIPVMTRSMPIDTAGFGALRAVTVGHLSADLGRVESSERFVCDALGVSGGWSPTLHLYAHAGGKLVYDDATGALRPASSHASIQLVGAAAGFDEPTNAVRHATEVGEAAAVQALQGHVGEAHGGPAKTLASGEPTSARQCVGLRTSPVGDTRRQWIDLLHDVTVADLELALRENYTSVEHVKRYTTVGMAADQGKTSAAVSIQTLARLRGIPAANLGYTTLRPPFMPTWARLQGGMLARASPRDACCPFTSGTCHTGR
jgi:sarcosine oxidase subunit alpha